MDLYPCEGQTLQATEQQPILLAYKGKTAQGEFHYRREVQEGRVPYDVYVKVDGKKITWRLQEEQKLYEGKSVGRNQFGPFSAGSTATIEPDHLLQKQCEEGDCLFLYMVREGVRLTLGGSPGSGFVNLRFEDPVCESSDISPDKRPSAKAR